MHRDTRNERVNESLQHPKPLGHNLGEAIFLDWREIFQPSNCKTSEKILRNVDIITFRLKEFDPNLFFSK